MKDKIINAFNKWIVGPLMKVAQNRYLTAVGNAFVTALPITIAGTFFLMLRSLPLGEGYANFLATTGLNNYLKYPQLVTNSILSIFIAYNVAASLYDSYGKKSKTVGLISICAFMLLVPFSKTITMADGTVETLSNVIPMNWLGAEGIFVAIFTGIVVAEVFRFFVSREWTIKLPDSVPPNALESFTSLIPGIAIITLFLVIRVGFEFSSVGSAHDFIYMLIQVPLSKLGNTFGAFLIITILMQLLWLVGIHGPNTAGNILWPIWVTASLVNLEAFTSGAAPTNVINSAFYYMYFNAFGGSGNTLPLAILLLLLAKSKQLKMLGKIAILPSFFNINEPLIFGIPIIFNPIMAIPFLLVPIITVSAGYFLTVAGILPVLPGIEAPSVTPFILKPFLMGGNSPIPLLVFYIVMFVITLLIYYPFFKTLDKNYLKQENADQESGQELEGLKEAV